MCLNKMRVKYTLFHTFSRFLKLIISFWQKNPLSIPTLDACNIVRVILRLLPANICSRIFQFQV